MSNSTPPPSLFGGFRDLFSAQSIASAMLGETAVAEAVEWKQRSERRRAREVPQTNPGVALPKTYKQASPQKGWAPRVEGGLHKGSKHSKGKGFKGRKGSFQDTEESVGVGDSDTRHDLQCEAPFQPEGPRDREDTCNRGAMFDFFRLCYCSDNRFFSVWHALSGFAQREGEFQWDLSLEDSCFMLGFMQECRSQDVVV